jgi:hypothetical protein
MTVAAGVRDSVPPVTGRAGVRGQPDQVASGTCYPGAGIGGELGQLGLACVLA